MRRRKLQTVVCFYSIIITVTVFSGQIIISDFKSGVYARWPGLGDSWGDLGALPPPYQAPIVLRSCFDCSSVWATSSSHFSCISPALSAQWLEKPSARDNVRQKSACGCGTSGLDRIRFGFLHFCRLSFVRSRAQLHPADSKILGCPDPQILAGLPPWRRQINDILHFIMRLCAAVWHFEVRHSAVEQWKSVWDS